jgi:hypothetical protein
VAKTLLGDCDDLVQYEEAKPELLETIDGMSVMIPICKYFNILTIYKLLAFAHIVSCSEVFPIFGNHKQHCAIFHRR